MAKRENDFTFLRGCGHDFDFTVGKERQLLSTKYHSRQEDANKESLRQKVKELEEFLTEREGQVTEYDDALVRKLIERITVHDEHFMVEFKSGIEIEVKL